MMNKFMKKIAAMLLIGTLSATAVTAATVSANDGSGIEQLGVSTTSMDRTMYVNNSAGANVRTAPSTDYRVLKKLSNGTAVHVTGRTSNGWYQIYTTDPVYGGETAGYISEGLLSTSAPSSGSSTSYGTKTVYVDTYLSLRSGPSSDYRELGRLVEGSRVQITGPMVNGYYPVAVVRAASGSTGSLDSGYVYGAYLE